MSESRHLESSNFDAQEIVRRFRLEPLPVEGGYFRVTWVSPQTWQGQGQEQGSALRSCGEDPSRSCDEPSPRSCGSVIYYLLTDEPQGFSALHVLDMDEVYHFYAGDPVELYLFEPQTEPQKPKMRRIELGTDFAAGQVPQAVVPGNTIQGSRLVGNGKWALLGTSMAPGYADDHFKIIYRNELINFYPESRQIIEALTRQ